MLERIADWFRYGVDWAEVGAAIGVVAILTSVVGFLVVINVMRVIY